MALASVTSPTTQVAPAASHAARNCASNEAISSAGVRPPEAQIVVAVTRPAGPACASASVGLSNSTLSLSIIVAFAA